MTTYEDELAQCGTLAELLMFTMLLIQLYGEDSTLRFDAGWNNIDVFIEPEHWPCQDTH